MEEHIYVKNDEVAAPRGVTGFKVQKSQCETCIYRGDSPLDIEKLEREISDPHGGFTTFRICHHSRDACCRGFWNRHKDEFQAGQVAQRLGLVQFVEEDTWNDVPPGPDPAEVLGVRAPHTAPAMDDGPVQGRVGGGEKKIGVGA